MPHSHLEGRTKGFERRFELEKELYFKIAMRTTKMMGRWAAEKLGLMGTDIGAYVESLLEVDLLYPHSNALLKRLEEDFTTAGLPTKRHELTAKLEEFFSTARREIGG